MSNVHLAGKGGGNRVPYVVRALQVKVNAVMMVAAAALDNNGRRQCLVALCLVHALVNCRRILRRKIQD
jgi:hypothetical protein